MAVLKPGAEAPPFALPDDAGREVRLEAFRGRWVVLFFYPADGMPFCMAEACEFRDRHAEFARAGAVVLGVSRDDPDMHARWRKSERLPFQLLSDESGEVLAAYDALGLYGHPKRITYVVDPDGIVADVYESQLRPKNHVERALRSILEGPAVREA